MLTQLDLLAQILLPSTLIAGVVFASIISWRFPKQIFLIIFLFRPLLEMSRLLKEGSEFVQWIINGVGVVVPFILLFVLVFHKKILLRQNLFLIAFIGVILLSSLTHEKSLEVAEILIRLISPLILIIFPQAIIQSEKDLKTFLQIIAISTFFVLVAVTLDWERTNIHPIYGWVQDAIILKSGEIQNRFAAVFGVPTTTAFWLFQFFAVTYFLFETDRSLKRWLWMGISILLLYPLFLTFSRGAWLACWVLIFSYSLLKGRVIKIGAWIIGIVTLAAIILPDIIYRLGNPTNIKGRLEFWYGYLHAMVSQGILPWVTGLGWANLPEKNLLSGHLFRYGSTGLVENSFIFVLVGAGLLALIIFIIIFLNLARWAWWLKMNGDTSFIRDYGIWTLSMLGAWFVMSMSGDMVLYVVINWYWYAFFGCSLALWVKMRHSLQSLNDMEENS